MKKRTNWSLVARKALKQAIQQEEMATAAEAIDRLRSPSKPDNSFLHRFEFVDYLMNRAPQPVRIRLDRQK
jgi:hypothetical protein